MTEPKSGNEIWKLIAVGFISLMVGMIFTKATEPKDTVTEKEMTLQVVNLREKIDAQTNEIAAIRSELVSISTSERQQAVDIGRIAQKVGVTASPVVAPANLGGTKWPMNSIPTHGTELTNMWIVLTLVGLLGSVLR